MVTNVAIRRFTKDLLQTGNGRQAMPIDQRASETDTNEANSGHRPKANAASHYHEVIHIGRGSAALCDPAHMAIATEIA
jgi:hypothetical protein